MLNILLPSIRVILVKIQKLQKIVDFIRRNFIYQINNRNKQLLFNVLKIIIIFIIFTMSILTVKKNNYFYTYVKFIFYNSFI